MTYEIGRRLQSMRERHGMTIADLAIKSGVSERQLHRIEASESNPKAGTLAKLAAAFNTDAARLLLGRDNSELDELVADNTCSFCGARLYERVSVDHEYGDAELDIFECGSMRGWENRPCREDPSFPKFEDYDLVFLGEQGSWACLARGKTPQACAVDLKAGSGETKEKAARWVQRAYAIERYGYDAAERDFPISELL